MADRNVQILLMLQRYPRLDWLMCDTLLNAPEDRLAECVKDPQRPPRVGQYHVLKAANIEENVGDLERHEGGP